MVNPIQTILLYLKLLQATVIKTKSSKARGANSVTLLLFCFAVVVVVVLLVAFLLCQYFAFRLLLITYGAVLTKSKTFDL